MPILTEITDHNRSCEAQSELLFIMITYIRQLEQNNKTMTEHPMKVLLWNCYMYSLDCNCILSLVQLPGSTQQLVIRPL